MTHIALACFEEQPDGSWICLQDTTIEGSRGYRAFIKRGKRAFFNVLRLLATTILPGILQASANNGPVPHRRVVTVQLRLAQQLRQLGDVGGDAPRLVFAGRVRC